MATRLARSYQLPCGKNISGMAKAVANYFGTLSGVDICAKEMNPSCFRVTCRTKSLNKSLTGGIKKIAGYDLDLTVNLYQQGGQVRVEYDQEIDEGGRVLKGLLLSAAVVGLVQLGGVKHRHEIPREINKAISAYLRQ